MAFSGFVKTIFIPATISLALYLVLTFAVLPFYRQYRQRYAHYLPLNSISSRTSSLRERASDALMRFLLPVTWRQRVMGQPTQHHEGRCSDESLLDEEEGEGMVGFDVNAHRGETRTVAPQNITSDRRLSRELEEGFRDDSDEEGDARIASSRTER